MTHYETLGVLPSASANEIRKAHRRLVIKYHPDKLRNATPQQAKRGEELFKRVQEAYETLTKHRAEYDKELEASAVPLGAQRSRTATEPPQAPIPYPPSRTNYPAKPKNGAWYYLGLVLRSNGLLMALAYAGLIGYKAYALRDAPAFLQWSTFSPFSGLPRITRYQAEQFDGIMRSQNANTFSEFRVGLIEASGSLSGCMDARQPSFGSGPVRGKYKGSDFGFTVTSPAGRTTFIGTRNYTDLAGTYRFEPKKGPEESGTFTLERVDTEEGDAGVAYQDCSAN